MSDINLLPKKEGLNLENDQAAIILRRISLAILSVTALSAIVLFILVVQSPLNKTRQQEQSLLSEIEKYKVTMSRSVIINERLISIGNILQTRNNLAQYISAILDIMPSSVTITSLSIADKTVQMTGNTQSLSATTAYFDGLIALQKEKHFVQSVILQSFSSQIDTGKYNFTLKIILL